jgi:hypothetical protein
MNPDQGAAVVKVAALRSRRAGGGDQVTAPRAQGAGAAGWRLAGIWLLAVGVAAALYVAGRLHQPDYSFSLFGTDPVAPKSLLATIMLGLAVLQVLLALWMYRKLPLAGCPPRPVPVAHRVTGFALVALTVPVAVHCLIAYGVQLTSPRVAAHSIAGCFLYGAFTAKVLLVRSRRLPGILLVTPCISCRQPDRAARPDLATPIISWLAARRWCDALPASVAGQLAVKLGRWRSRRTARRRGRAPERTCPPREHRWPGRPRSPRLPLPRLPRRRSR